MASINKLKTLDVLASTQSMNAAIVSQANNGDMFLSMLARVNEREVRYVGIAIDESRLEMVKSGEISLLDAFLGRQGCWIDCKAKSPKANVMDAMHRDDEIPLAYLPPDVKLYPAVADSVELAR